ncbi:hypothetical protein, partial [Pseudomonas sp. BN607]|uniref:hypothetical protein n=1 Tax=Pseudomonas sp. BN607 TaxID=2567895 RepID=UPI002457770B
ACVAMSPLIRPSCSALSTSKKLDLQQSIYVCFGPITPVMAARDRLVCTLQYRVMRQGVRAQIRQE